MLNAALIGFAFFGLFSPGPNVILITTSGARFGFAKTIPHIAGIVVGVGIIGFVTGIGIAVTVAAIPIVQLILSILAAIWILYLAYKLWIAPPPAEDPDAKPFTFVQAVLFQWVNPKIWAVSVAATAFIDDGSAIVQGLVLGGTLSTINAGVCTFWTSTGTLLTVLLNKPKAWRIFSRTMAVALCAFTFLLFV